MRFYEARAAGDQARAAGVDVLVLHEFFGLTEREAAIADALACREGVRRALAVDMWAGEGATERLIPRAIWLALRPGGRREAVRRVAAFANAVAAPADGASEEAPAVATLLVGFCYGGGVAARAAAALGAGEMGGRPAAFACFYGAPLDADAADDEEALRRLRGTRALLVYGGRDAQFPPAAVDAYERALEAAGAHARVARYPAQGHAFLRAVPEDGDGSNADAADAWRELEAFVDQVAADVADAAS